MQKVLLHSQIELLRSYLDKNMFHYLQYGQISKFECYEGINLICFDWYDTGDIELEPSFILIYHSNENLFFFCENQRVYDKVSTIVSNADITNERMIHTFFAELIKGDIQKLEMFEEDITDTEDALLTTSKKDCAKEIIEFRQRLLSLKKYYEQLNQILDEIIENEMKLFSKKELQTFRNLDSKINRLFAHVLNLRDYVTQVREAYQAQIDIEQNTIMKTFTVITTIFLPLTLIVGWYGMNLKIPEFDWELGYLFVIILSVAVVVGCLIFFKIRKWY